MLRTNYLLLFFVIIWLVVFSHSVLADGTTTDVTNNVVTYWYNQYQEAVNTVEGYGSVFAVSLATVGLLTFFFRR